MKNILLIGNFLSKHGINPTYSEILFDHLVQARVPVSFASDQKNIFLRFFDMTTKVLKQKSKNSLVVIDLYSGRKAIIYGQWISFLSRKIDIPYFVVLHGGNLPELNRKNPGVLEPILSHAKKIIAPSNYMGTEFSKYPNIHIIPNAIDVDAYEFYPKESIRPNIMFLRSFHKLTRPKDAIYCIHKLLNSYPEAQLTMAGGDEDGTLGECLEIVSELKLKNHIKFTGRLPKNEIYKLSLDHDIFIHTMAVDNMPVSILEAMALGLCIVATNVGGMSYMIENDLDAQLVNPGDVDGMSNAIKKYLDNQDYALKIRLNARRKVLNFNWTLVLPMWIKLFEEIS